jgi:hypothetical protein
LSEFKLIDFVDAAIISQENKEPRASRIPAVWPSEASALRIDKTEGNIVGACHRKSFGRMVGWPISNKADAVSSWRFVTGRSVETHLTTLTMASKPPIYAASGVRHFVKDIYLPFELDLVVKDPSTNTGWIVECKTIYGYMANKQIIDEGKPKLENLMQAVLYLLEIKTGSKLKEIIKAGWAERQSIEAAAIAAGLEPKLGRNRIDISNLEFVNEISDGQVGAKLVYISRDECARKEFDITIQEDFDGSLYPAVDGMMWRVFTVESIYERFKTLQNYWYQARREAVARLAAKGIHPPPHLKLVLGPEDKTNPKEMLPNAEAERRLEAKGVTPPPTLRLVRGPGQEASKEEGLTQEQKAAEYDYLDKLERETASLPVEFWPPAEYQWAYPPDKIELLYQRGLIGKKRYEDWKKKKAGADRIGDWQCLYCPFKKMCVPKQNPAWSYQLYDMDAMLPVTNDNEL